MILSWNRSPFRTNIEYISFQRGSNSWRGSEIIRYLVEVYPLGWYNSSYCYRYELANRINRTKAPWWKVWGRRICEGNGHGCRRFFYLPSWWSKVYIIRSMIGRHGWLMYSIWIYLGNTPTFDSGVLMFCAPSNYRRMLARHGKGVSNHASKQAFNPVHLAPHGTPSSHITGDQYRGSRPLCHSYVLSLVAEIILCSRSNYSGMGPTYIYVAKCWD